MNFDFKNIIRHKLSTVIGLILLLFFMLLPLQTDVTYAEVTPMLVIVIPFLLYGNPGNPGSPNPA